MHVIDLPVGAISPAPWNPNAMDEAMRARLERSIQRFGLVVPLVVRPVGHDRYETIGGAQRLAVVRDLGHTTVPCVVVPADGADARLLTQALNRIADEDDPGLRTDLLRDILERYPPEEVLSLLPEAAETLQAIASIGQQSLAEHLQAWQQAQAARLKHFQVQLTPSQSETVTEALARFLPQVAPGDDGNPNRRGLALYNLCRSYLELAGGLP